MAVSDLEAFIRERLGIYDSSLDTSVGSPLDTQVVQPILRRLGADPFTVDFVQFAQDRLAQEFPDMATKDGDAITDLLIKPAMVLMDPVIRENVRIKNAQSFRDPEILTIDEASALGANLFAQISTGDKARGQARIYFAAPQQASISPANFLSSRSGLHFYPTSVQSIRSDEMIFNVEGSLYYFDVNVEAEGPGDAYNIGPDELVSIANITAAVRVTNKRRFRFGIPAETAPEFIGRAEQELSEKSLVTQRGAIAKLTTAFSEISNVAVVGFSDPEMQRDVVRGGGLGGILASGFLMHPISDGESAACTRRLQVDISESVDFLTTVGKAGRVEGFVLTVYGGLSGVPQIRDLRVRAVVDARTLDLEDQVVVYSLSADLPWTLRKSELTLSGIPGGIVFPSSVDGLSHVPDDQVHIGGAADYFVRATDFDANVLVLDAVVDDAPLLLGAEAFFPGGSIIRLGDYVLNTDYASNDETFRKLERAADKGFSLQVLEGPAAGSYRVTGVTHVAAQSVQLQVDPAPTTPPGNFRWRLLDTLEVDLISPKETKISGADLRTIQGLDEVQTLSGIDFQSYGVGPGDVLKIENGPDAGEFVVEQVLTPLFQKIRVDRPLTATSANLKFSVYRANSEGGISLPLVRFTSVELLDPSGQATGTKVPYANPIDVRTVNLANVAHGLKEDLTDVRLGMVSPKLTSGVNLSGLVLRVLWQSWDPLVLSTTVTTVTFSGANPLSAATIVSQINTAFGMRVASVVDTNRVGILPFGKRVWSVPTGGDTATAVLFGSDDQYSTADVRSSAIDNLVDRWGTVSPAIDPNYDVVEVLDGYQIGFYDQLSLPYGDKSALVPGNAAFLPEVDLHVRVGSRSLGVARCFFLEPTSIEFDANALFTAELSNGSVLSFLPDAALSYQIIPALPNDLVPKDGSFATMTQTLTSPSGDFFRQGVLVGDKLEITYQPVEGTQTLLDPVPSLAHTTIVLSVGGGVDKTIIYVTDDPGIGAANVTRKGVADQINKQVGQKICSITGSNTLEFDADVSVIIRKTGTANTILGFSTVTDTDNSSDIRGTYTIAAMTATTLTTVEAVSPSGTYTRQHFKVMRPRLQRIVSTQMSTQLDAAGLYYCDVEIVSQGTGDRYNLPAGVELRAAGFSSDGYWISTEDPNLTFSTAERPVLHLSRSILEVGVSDSPVNATQISGQNLQISYERSSLVSSVQSFVSAEEERVLCESPLARHLIPYFVRFDLSYVGGSKEDTVLPDLEKFIQELAPQDYLRVSDVSKIVQNRGALSVENPINLIAVVHNFDRSVVVERSQDKINTGKLAAFVPDVLNVKRKFS